MPGNWSITSREFAEACDAVNEKENPCPGCRQPAQRMFRPIRSEDLGEVMQTTCVSCGFISLYEADALLRRRRMRRN